MNYILQINLKFLKNNKFSKVDSYLTKILKKTINNYFRIYVALKTSFIYINSMHCTHKTYTDRKCVFDVKRQNVKINGR